ncbi:MAG TPA: DUF1080 domain-containing protein [Acidobacteriota bacterium]|nr:DUF1080 domain-containing protein [Acidobacteriota bacterium]
MVCTAGTPRSARSARRLKKIFYKPDAAWSLGTVVRILLAMDSSCFRSCCNPWVPLGILTLVFLSGPVFAAEQLFNGHDLTGWVEVGGRGVFTVENGEITARPGGLIPTWLRTEQEFDNFRLRLEYLTPGWCEAGLLLFAPLYGRQSQVGLKLHLRHDNADEGARSTGALYDVVAPLRLAAGRRGAWNRLEVVSRYPRLTVVLNGVVIQDVDRDLHPTLRWRRREGFIGLQYLGSPIRFRNLEIERLEAGRDEWLELCNGKDLDGWEVRGAAPWRVDNGVIAAGGGDGYLITRRSFSSFVFETFVRTSPQANGGVFFRWGDENGRGYEVQIYNVEEATNPTGSLYGLVPAPDLRARDEEWFMLQIVSSGASALVFVNGHPVVQAHNLELPDQGRITLQMHSPGKIEFLRPRIRPLHPATEVSPIPPKPGS